MQIAENLTDTHAQNSADCDEVQSLKVRYDAAYRICSIEHRGVYQVVSVSAASFIRESRFFQNYNS